MGIMSGIGGLVGGAMGLFGGGSNQPQAPPSFIMPNMGGAANNTFAGIQGLGGYGSTAQGTQGPASSTFQNLYNNPFSGLFLGGAQTGSALGQNAALGAYGTGGALQGAGLGTLPMAGQLFSSGFDPQNALYSRTLQQVQEQTRAGQEARGIAMTPYGAGLENQAIGNFNIDWQNNLLQRQAMAAQAGGGLLQQGGNLANLGTGMQNLAGSQFMNAAGMPYGAFGNIGGAQNQAIESLLGLTGAAQNVSNLPVQDWLSYIGAGNQAGGVANQNYANQLAANNQQFNQQMQFGSMLGGSLYGLGQGGFGMGNMFGFGGGPNMFSPGGQFSPMPSFINSSGDLMSAGQITPG